MLNINQVAMQQGNRLLFDDVTLKLNAGNRYALVGANGVGKSTLLNILSGELEPTLGEFSFPKATQIGMLKQDHYLYENNRVVDAVIRGKTALWDALQEKEAIYNKPELTDKDGYRLAALERNRRARRWI